MEHSMVPPLAGFSHLKSESTSCELFCLWRWDVLRSHLSATEGLPQSAVDKPPMVYVSYKLLDLYNLCLTLPLY